MTTPLYPPPVVLCSLKCSTLNFMRENTAGIMSVVIIENHVNVRNFVGEITNNELRGLAVSRKFLLFHPSRDACSPSLDINFPISGF